MVKRPPSWASWHDHADGFLSVNRCYRVKATKRKRVGNEWEFAFSGNIPDTPPRVDDETLTKMLKRLIDSKSPLLSAPLAMELALSPIHSSTYSTER